MERKIARHLITTHPTVREGNGTPLQNSCLENPMDGEALWAAVHGVEKSWTRLSDFTFTFHFHPLEKEMATHSSVLALRIPGTGEPGGLPSMGSHRVGHNWSDLAAAAAAAFYCLIILPYFRHLFLFHLSLCPFPSCHLKIPLSFICSVMFFFFLLLSSISSVFLESGKQEGLCGKMAIRVCNIRL